MTTKQKFIDMLVQRGMFESQAEQVMEKAMPVIDSTVENYRFTWDRPASEYPEQLYPMIFSTTIKPIALAWIEENKPMAWFKAIFQ